MWLTDDNRKIDTFNWSPKGATIKKGPRAAWDKAISAYPIKHNGYNDFFDKVLEMNIKIFLNHDLKTINLKKKKFLINKKIEKFDIVISSIAPDFFFNYRFGELKFIGRDFHKIVFPSKEIFPKNVYFLYYANDEKFTRLVEYKKFTKHKSNTTLIGIEYPSKNGKHYPLPFKKDISLSHRYLKLLPEWFFSIGRAGSYRYEVDIDDSIEQAMSIKEIIDSQQYLNAMPIQKWWKVK
jgi:UDP-galactopyranose mutase